MQRNAPVYTLVNHAEHLENLLQTIQNNPIEASNDKDEINANNQLEFLKTMLIHIKAMLALSTINVSAKKELGQKMTALTQQYFGDEEVPTVEGEKSRAYAIQVAKHYRSFTKVQFNSFEIDMSRLASSFSFLNIRSIPDQIAHHQSLVEKTENNINKYDKQGLNLT